MQPLIKSHRPVESPDIRQTNPEKSNRSRTAKFAGAAVLVAGITTAIGLGAVYNIGRKAGQIRTFDDYAGLDPHGMKDASGAVVGIRMNSKKDVITGCLNDKRIDLTGCLIAYGNPAGSSNSGLIIGHSWDGFFFGIKTPWFGYEK